MNLLVALGCSHLIMALLSNRIFATQRIVCHALAFLQHYFWLCSFAWMGAISFDVFFTLSAVFSLLNGDRYKKMIYRYILFCWIAPALFPCICIYLTETNQDIRYDVEYKCWLANAKSVLVMFGIPVFMVLIFNGTLFVGCLIRLKQLSVNATNAGRSEDAKIRLSICVKMAAWMGG